MPIIYPRPSCQSGLSYHACQNGFIGCCSVDPCGLGPDATCPDIQSITVTATTSLVDETVSTDTPTLIEREAEAQNVETLTATSFVATVFFDPNPTPAAAPVLAPAPAPALAAANTIPAFAQPVNNVGAAAVPAPDTPAAVVTKPAPTTETSTTPEPTSTIPLPTVTVTVTPWLITTSSTDSSTTTSSTTTSSTQTSSSSPTTAAPVVTITAEPPVDTPAPTPTAAATATAPSLNAPVTTKKSGTSPGVIAGVVIVVLILIGSGIGGYFFWKRRQNKSRGGSTDKRIDEAGNYVGNGDNSSGVVDGRGIDQPEQAKPSLLESVKSGLSALWCFGKRQDSDNNGGRSRYQGGSVGGSNSATTGYNEGEYNADFDQKSPGLPNPYRGPVSATRGSVSATPGATPVAELPGNTSSEQSTFSPQARNNFEPDPRRSGGRELSTDPTVNSKSSQTMARSSGNNPYKSPY